MKNLREFQLNRSLLEQFFQFDFDIFKLMQGTFIEQEIGRHNIIAGTKFVIGAGEYKLFFSVIKNLSHKSKQILILPQATYIKCFHQRGTARQAATWTAPAPTGCVPLGAAGHTNKNLCIVENVKLAVSKFGDNIIDLNQNVR